MENKWMGLTITQPNYIFTVHSSRIDNKLIIAYRTNDMSKLTQLMTLYVQQKYTLYPCTINFVHEHVEERILPELIIELNNIDVAIFNIDAKINEDHEICKRVNRDTYLTKFDSQKQIYNNTH